MVVIKQKTWYNKFSYALNTMRVWTIVPRDEKSDGVFVLMKVTSKLNSYNILCRIHNNRLYVVRLDVTRKTSASYPQVNLSPNRDVLYVLGSSI